MRKKDNQKQAQGQTKREPLTYKQMNQLSMAIGQALCMEDDATASLIMIVLEEITANPFNTPHVETLCHLIKAQLFRWTTMEFEEAEAAYIKTQRECFFEAQEGGRA